MTRQDIRNLITIFFALVLEGLAALLNTINNIKFNNSIYIISLILTFFSIIIVLTVIIKFLYENNILRGSKYFLTTIKLKRNICKHLLDSNIYINRGNFDELPNIKIKMNYNLLVCKVAIENSIKFNKTFENISLSPALYNYIVKKSYLSDDENYYIFELVDSASKNNLIFKTISEFKDYNNNFDNYQLFFDKEVYIDFQSILIVGTTGSGKTYSLYSIILQLLLKNVKHQLYFADLKKSSISKIGESISRNRTAITFQETIDLISLFNEHLLERASIMSEKLPNKLDSDYKDTMLKAHVLIIDEYAAFSAYLDTQDSKLKRQVKSMLMNIILMGRQLGFFVIFAMQKSDASIIDTALRENIPFKMVLGQSGQQTYITTFGTGVEIPEKHYLTGEGLFTEPRIAPNPENITNPTLNFKIDSNLFAGGIVKTPSTQKNGDYES